MQSQPEGMSAVPILLQFRVKTGRVSLMWKTSSLLAAALLLVSPGFGQSPFDIQASKALLEARISQDYPSLEKLYQHLHAHPELSLQEENTARTLAGELRALGIDVTEKVGGHGVVGVLRNGDGPVVLVRADMDALPLKEKTGLPYASNARAVDDSGSEVDVMHACGHDVHMTALIGTARLLAHFKKLWQGTLVFICQPAEERGLGARAMLEDGLYTRFPKPQFALAIHVNAELPAGVIGLTEGYATANVDSVDITIRGAGGHGARPHHAKDPITLAAQTIVALQTIVSREVDPLDPAVVTVGSIRGGTKHNIIPDEVHLQLTVRTFADPVRDRVLEAIRRIVRGQAMAAGIPEDRMPTVVVSDEFTPSGYHDPELTRRMAGVFRKLFGEDKIIERKPTMGGEDFGLLGRTPDRIPICMFSVGSVERERFEESRRTGKPLPSVHSSLYYPDAEPTIKTAVLAMATAVMDLMAGK
jgi:amidohydrolase